VPTVGIFHFETGAWVNISASNPSVWQSILATLYASFAGSGTYKWTKAAGWVQISASDAIALTAFNGVLYANLSGAGIYYWDGTWHSTTWPATDIITGDGTAGSSGTSGTDGSHGTSGSSGTSGSVGTSGTSGTSGSVGTSGTSGTSGSGLTDAQMIMWAIVFGG
jgi:hypothetical protein